MKNDDLDVWPKWLISTPNSGLARREMAFPGAIRLVDGRLVTTEVVLFAFSTEAAAVAAIEEADFKAGLAEPSGAIPFAVDKEEFISIASSAAGKGVGFFCLDHATFHRLNEVR